jgi:predicted nucleotidyltransferase
MLNEDYKDMLQTLLDNEVKFLIVGAYALAAYGYPRATGDFDIWIEASAENSKKILSSLTSFGAPTSGLTEKTFMEKGIVFQIGIAPRRIDLITHIDGVDFSDAYPSRKTIVIEGLNLPFISKENLIQNKKSTGRDKDLVDVKHLEENGDA